MGNYCEIGLSKGISPGTSKFLEYEQLGNTLPCLNRMTFISRLTQSLKNEWFKSPASTSKSGSSPSHVNMFASSFLNGSNGCAVDNHPNHHNWSSGNIRIFPL